MTNAEHCRLYRERHPEAKERQKAYYKKWSEAHKKTDAYRAKQRAYYASHRDEIKKERDRRIVQKAEYDREYRRLHAEKLAQYRQSYKISHPEKLRENARRQRSTIQGRMRSNLRTRINGAIRIRAKSGHSIELLGCSIAQLMMHLESQFKNGMSWENWGRGGWHIDHIRPCASFDLAVPAQQRQCFHYSNLQPLWARENISKGARVA
ncbi:MAG: hypothetical protein ABFC85_07435 [Rectinema sp.]